MLIATYPQSESRDTRQSRRWSIQDRWWWLSLEVVCWDHLHSRPPWVISEQDLFQCFNQRWGSRSLFCGFGNCCCSKTCFMLSCFQRATGEACFPSPQPPSPIKTGCSVSHFWRCLIRETFIYAGGSGFFLTCEESRRMFHHSFLACNFFFFFEVEISSCKLIPLFIPGPVHSGSVSWDDCGRMFPVKLCVSSFTG